MEDSCVGMQYTAERTSMTSTKKIKVAFVVHNMAIWSSLHNVYTLMNEAGSGFLPKVFTLPCDHTSSGNYEGEDHTYAELKAMGIKAIRPDNKTMSEHLAVLKNFAPDYLFRQTPWELHLPPEFRVGNLNSFTRLCYIPYGFLTANIEQRQFNQEYHRSCWGIFCETKLHRLLYEKNSPDIGFRNVAATGYPRFETLWERRNEKYWPTKVSDGDTKIIWAPHHSIDTKWLGFSTFIDNHMQFLKLARQSPSLHIALRPHPALFSKLLANGVPQENIDRFIHDFTSLPNTALYEEGDYIPLFGASDLLITDGIGFFSEYMLTGKPIIYTDSGRSFGFNDAGKLLVDGLYRATNFNEVLTSLTALLENDDPLRATRERIAKVLFNPSKPSPSQQILQIIKTAHNA